MNLHQKKKDIYKDRDYDENIQDFKNKDKYIDRNMDKAFRNVDEGEVEYWMKLKKKKKKLEEDP